MTLTDPIYPGKRDVAIALKICEREGRDIPQAEELWQSRLGLGWVGAANIGTPTLLKLGLLENDYTLPGLLRMLMNAVTVYRIAVTGDEAGIWESSLASHAVTF